MVVVVDCVSVISPLSLSPEVDPGIDRGQEHQKRQAYRFVVHCQMLLRSEGTS